MLVLVGAGCARKPIDTLPIPESEEEISERELDEEEREEAQLPVPPIEQDEVHPSEPNAPPAGDCIPVEVYEGYTTCVMSEPQNFEGQDPNDDEDDEDSEPNTPHKESDDPNPARD